MIPKESFEEVYSKIIDENAQDFKELGQKAESERVHNRKIFLTSFLIFVAIMWISAMIIDHFWPIHKSDFGSDLLIFMLVVAIFVAGVYAGKNRTMPENSDVRKFKLDYKEKVIGRLIKAFGDEFNFNYNGGIDVDSYKDADFETLGAYRSHDHITGLLNNRIGFELAEVETYTYYKDYKGQKHYKDIFHGLVAKIPLSRDVIDSLYLRVTKQQYDEYNIIHKKFPKKLKFTVESEEFENLFDTYATNELLAFQILTPEVVQMLCEFREKMTYEITLKNNTLYIRFWCGEMFEQSMFDEFAIDKPLLKKYYDMVYFIVDVMEKIVEKI